MWHLQVLSRAETSAEIDETGTFCGLGCAQSAFSLRKPSTRRVGRTCQQSLSEASMLPVLSILILQGQLANINTLEWLRVAPAGCMRALQRPWIYRGNGHILIYVSARHAAARHDHRWWGRNRDGQRQSPWLDGGCGVGNVNGSSSYSWEGESGSQARRDTRQRRWSGSEAVTNGLSWCQAIWTRVKLAGPARAASIEGWWKTMKMRIIRISLDVLGCSNACI